MRRSKELLVTDNRDIVHGGFLSNFIYMIFENQRSMIKDHVNKTGCSTVAQFRIIELFGFYWMHHSMK